MVVISAGLTLPTSRGLLSEIASAPSKGFLLAELMSSACRHGARHSSGRWMPPREQLMLRNVFEIALNSPNLCEESQRRLAVY